MAGVKRNIKPDAAGGASGEAANVGEEFT